MNWEETCEAMKSAHPSVESFIEMWGLETWSRACGAEDREIVEDLYRTLIELGVKPNVEYSNNHDKYKAFFLAYKAHIASQSPDSPNADYLKTAEEFRVARVEAEKLQKPPG